MINLEEDNGVEEMNLLKKAVMDIYYYKFTKIIVDNMSNVIYWEDLFEFLIQFPSNVRILKHIETAKIFINITRKIKQKDEKFTQRIFLFLEKYKFYSRSERGSYELLKRLTEKEELDVLINSDMTFRNVYDEIFNIQDFLILIYKILTSNVYINSKPFDLNESKKFQNFLKENITNESDLKPFFNQLIKFVKLPPNIKGITTHYLQIFINLTDPEIKVNLSSLDKNKVNIK